MKKLILAILCGVMLVGCSSVKDSVELQTEFDEATMNSFDNSYYKIINRGGSSLRESFYFDFYDSTDFETIGRGLQILSSDHFSTNSYYMSEGQYLGQDHLTQLLRRSEDASAYPYTLQSARGETIEGVLNPIMVSNVTEQNYYTREGNKYVLKGTSLAIILDPRDADNKRLDVEMSDETIAEFGKQCIERLYKYIQESGEISELANIPLVITVFKASNTDVNAYSGNYILKAHCSGGVGNIETVNHRNILFTSSQAEAIDKATFAEFSAIKSTVKNAATEAAGFVGTAKYINDQIQSMVINATLNVKTYTELLYLTSLIADQIDTKFTYNFSIRVLVSSQDGLKAVIVKQRGQSAQTYELY